MKAEDYLELRVVINDVPGSYNESEKQYREFERDAVLQTDRRRKKRDTSQPATAQS